MLGFTRGNKEKLSPQPSGLHEYLGLLALPIIDAFRQVVKRNLVKG